MFSPGIYKHFVVDTVAVWMAHILSHNTAQAGACHSRICTCRGFPGELMQTWFLNIFALQFCSCRGAESSEISHSISFQLSMKVPVSSELRTQKGFQLKWLVVATTFKLTWRHWFMKSCRNKCLFSLVFYIFLCWCAVPRACSMVKCLCFAFCLSAGKSYIVYTSDPCKFQCEIYAFIV